MTIRNSYHSTPRRRFALFCLGSYGDVLPFVAVAKCLKERGHEALVATNPHFGDLIEAHNLGFVPVGTAQSLRAAGLRKGIKTEREGWKEALRWGALGTMREMHSIAMALADGDTVFVAQQSCFGVRVARDQAAFPLATISLDPVQFRSTYRSPFLPRPLVLEDWVPRLSKRLQLRIADRFFVDPVLEPANDFRRELGLPPVRRFLHKWCHSPDLVIGMFPPWYSEPQPDWPEQARLAGFPAFSPPGESDASATRFSQQATRLLVFSPGSAGPRSNDYFREAVKICADLNASGLLLTRNPNLVPDELPSNVKHFDYVRMDVALKHASAVVHQGGIGTVACSLRSGVPQLVVPMAFNQPDDARRIKRLGVGDMISPEKFQARKVVPLLARLMDSPEVAQKCKQYSEQLEDEDGAELASTELESLIARLSSR